MPSKPKKKQSRGRPRLIFADEERSIMLRLLRKGFGIQTALAELKIGYRRFDRTLQEFPDFALEIRNVIALRDEQLIAIRYAQALEGEPSALEFMISRADRARQFKLRMDLRRAELLAFQTANASAQTAFTDAQETSGGQTLADYLEPPNPKPAKRKPN
jgi:hypothetical protein